MNETFFTCKTKDEIVTVKIPAMSNQSDIDKFLKDCLSILEASNIDETTDLVKYVDLPNDESHELVKTYIRSLFSGHPFFSTMLNVSEPSVVDAALRDYLSRS